MKTNHSFKRSALALAIGLTVAGGAFAQSSVGSIYGHADAEAKVVIESAATGQRREITADASGRFSVTQLAPGTYKVTSGGQTREVVVRVGTGSSVELKSAASLTEIVVTGAEVNPIDMSSVESTAVFTAEQIEALPVARDITNVALLAPGTVKGDTGFGNLASFGGSSVAENGYYINGFDVTNIRNFVAYSTLPFEALGEQQIKTGGYGAEFGRSLGGVISVVTKRGTNEWEFGASAYWRPEWARESGKDVDSRNPTDLANNSELFVYRSDNEADSVVYNLYGGGPLIQDRLFMFALLEGVDSSSDTYGRTTSQATSNSEPNGMLKLDWNITDNHILEFTGIRDKSITKYRDYSNFDDNYYVGEHQDLSAEYEIENGGDIFIGKYTGYLADNFTLSVQAGQLNNVSSYQTPESLPGGDCPRAYDSQANRAAVIYVGCWSESQTFIRDADWGPDEDERESYRIDAEWSIGDHLVRFGWDDETFTSGHAGQTYTGGIYWRHFFVYESAGRNVNGTVLPQGTYYTRSWDYFTSSGSYEVANSAFYLEDSWQITDSFVGYLGLRSESFENSNAAGETFVESGHKLAPRLGFAWDVSGDGSLKMFGNAGRYFIPVAANTNIRASGTEAIVEEYFFSTGFNPADGTPTGLGAQIGGTNVNGSIDPPVAGTIAATNLSPMYQDEYILGFQKVLENDWMIGLKAIRREIKDGMDDFCSVQPFQDWADDNGYTDFDYHSLASCFIMNPGRDVGILMDLDGTGALTEVTIPASYFGLPKYTRAYNALEFLWEKVSDNWALQGSYTWSKSYGNVEGYVNSSLEQDDAGLTQDFDNAVFEDGAYGDLPNDRRHVVKMFGSYRLNDQWSFGGNFLLSSGRPVNCLGFAPLGDDLDSGTLAFYGSSSFYCVNEDGSTVLGQRGQEGRTPWTWNIDASVGYAPSFADGKLVFRATVYNLFNQQRVTEYSETSAIGSASSNAYNPNFLNDVNYQTPRSVQFSVRYDF